MAEMNLGGGVWTSHASAAQAAENKERVMKKDDFGDFGASMMNFSNLASTVHTYLWRNKVDVSWPYYLQNLDKGLMCMRVVLVPKHDCLLVRKSARCIPAPAWTCSYSVRRIQSVLYTYALNVLLP